MAENLKPCPFCGGEVQVDDDLPEYSCVEDPGFFVFCPTDSLYFGYSPEFGGQFATIYQAAKAWNRRVQA